jgi:hypothetical protein
MGILEGKRDIIIITSYTAAPNARALRLLMLSILLLFITENRALQPDERLCASLLAPDSQPSHAGLGSSPGIGKGLGIEIIIHKSNCILIRSFPVFLFSFYFLSYIQMQTLLRARIHCREVRMTNLCTPDNMYRGYTFLRELKIETMRKATRTMPKGVGNVKRRKEISSRIPYKSDASPR